jgi:hypothetical protein
MKPFSTPVLSKRTYRELKLLKHLRHENVSRKPATYNHARMLIEPGHLPQRHLHISARGHLFCYRTTRDRSSSIAHFKAAREAVHPVLPVSNSGKWSNNCVVDESNAISAASNMFTRQVSFTEISSPRISSSTRTAISKYATLVWHAFRILR